MSRDPFNTTWVEQDAILAGSLPTGPQDIATLRGMGIRSILSLTRRALDCPGMQAELNAIDVGHFPIPDHGLADDNTMLTAASFLATAPKPCYVHCRGGIGRTGTVLIAYYVLHRGLSLEEARQKVSVRRNYQGNASARDQGSPQREWIDKLPLLKGNNRQMRTLGEWQSLIELCGVHPVLGPVGRDYWIEQTPEELATFLHAIAPDSGQHVPIRSYDRVVGMYTFPQSLSLLEIGAGFRHGLARFLTEMGWRVTSIDKNLPTTPARDVEFIHEDSATAHRLLVDRSFDVVLIDGDHTYEAVKRDYELYSIYADKVVALHDIAGLRDCGDVERFWHEIAYTKTGKLRKGYFEAIAEHDKRSGLGWIVK